MISKLFAALVTLVLCSPFVQSQPPSHGGNRAISGVVVSATNNQPLAGAKVTLQSTAHFQLVGEATTDSAGRFSFVNLPDGKFILSGWHRGYAASAYEQHDGPLTAIVTGEDQVTTGLTLSLPPLGSIFGRVIEDSGDPVPSARLQLYWRARFNGVQSVRRGMVAMADEMGNFEIQNIAPGEYYLCASGTPWYRSSSDPTRRSADPSLLRFDVAYPLTCYPDSPNSAGAESIEISAGGRVQADVTMHALPAMHVIVDEPTSETQRAVQMPQVDQVAFGISDPALAQLNVLPPDSQGEAGIQRIEISGIPAGQYTIELQGENPLQSSARVGAIDVSSSDAHVDLASLSTTASVSGSLTIAGGGRSPADYTIYLYSGNGNSGGYAKVATDGTFHIPSVRPGEYEVAVVAASTTNSVLQVTRLSATGSAITDSLLEVRNTPIQLSVTAAAAVATVAAIVTHNGKPASGVFALLVPQKLNGSRYTWYPNQSDSDGSVTFDQVAPGEYTVVAIESGWTIDWRRPEIISRYLPGGVRVTVAPNATEVKLGSPVEAQHIGVYKH